MDELRKLFGPAGWRIFATSAGNVFAQRAHPTYPNLYQTAGPAPLAEVAIALEVLT